MPTYDKQTGSHGDQPKVERCRITSDMFHPEAGENCIPENGPACDNEETLQEIARSYEHARIMGHMQNRINE